MSSFLIDLATLRPGMSQVAVEAEAAALGLEAWAWAGPVRGRFDVDKNGERVSVRGRLDQRSTSASVTPCEARRRRRIASTCSRPGGVAT